MSPYPKFHPKFTESRFAVYLILFFGSLDFHFRYLFAFHAFFGPKIQIYQFPFLIFVSKYSAFPPSSFPLPHTNTPTTPPHATHNTPHKMTSAGCPERTGENQGEGSVELDTSLVLWNDLQHV